MKKTTLLLTFFLGIILNQQAQNLWYKVDNNGADKFEMTFFRAPIKTQEVKTDNGYFTRLAMDDCHVSNTIGAPELPVSVKMIEIPLCENAVLNVTPGSFDIVDATLYGIQYPIYPAQPSYAKSYEGPVDFKKSQEVYSADQFYGDELVRLETNGVFRDVNLATLYFSPIQYNPVTHQLKIYHSAKVEIFYENADMPATLEMKNLHGNGLFKGAEAQIINPLTANSTRERINSVPVKYLIVAHSMFRGYFENFVAWKKQKGFIVEVAYTDDMAVGTTTTSIAAFIKSKYSSATQENPAPSYVLLMGDIQQIPAFIKSDGYSTHPTDLYYFTWSEGDNLPDCYYGRMSAQTVEQLTAQITKTLKYEKLEFEDISFLNKAVLVAGTDNYWSPTHANGQVNYLSGNYINQENGYTTVYKHNYNCSSQAAQIRSEISGGTGFANYTAHCDESGWGDPEFSTSHINSMSNINMYGLMIGNCCLSSKFDESACFGEAITRAANKGAVAYIGGSNNTYWDEDYCWSMGVRQNKIANPTYDPNNLGAFDRLFHTHGEAHTDWYTTCGSIITAGNLAVQATTSSRKNYYWEIYTLMGDPSLMPYLAAPQTMDVDIPDNIFIGAVNLDVVVVPYAYVALLKGDELLAATFADGAGNATLTFSAIEDADELTLAASAQNYKHYFHSMVPFLPDGRFVYAKEMTLNGDDILKISDHRRWDLTVKNIGNADAQQVYAKLSTESPHVIMLQDSAYVGDVAMDAEITLTNLFEIKMSDFVEDQTIIPFKISICDNNGEVSVKNIRLKIAAPKLSRVDFQIEESEGNFNGVFEPGEKIKVTVKDKNIGHLNVNNVEMALISRYSKVSVENSLNYGISMPANGTAESSFYVQLDQDLDNLVVIPLYYRVKCGRYEVYDTLTLSVGQVVEDFESNDFNSYNWENLGNNPWIITSVNPYAGTYSAKSANNLSDNASSGLGITLNILYDDEISYYRKVSSEDGYDIFTFAIDGTVMEELSGTVNWERATFPVTAGLHTFTFTYEKDFTTKRGSDCAWIDNVYLPGQAGVVENDREVDFPTGISKFAEKSTVNVYPNPATHAITISADERISKIEIIDIHGRLVKSVTGSGNHSEQLSISELAKGIYLVRIVTNETDIMVKKIVKQ